MNELFGGIIYNRVGAECYCSLLAGRLGWRWRLIRQ